MSDIQITYFEELKRKLIHLSSLWMVFAVVLIPNRWITAGLFAFLLAGTLLWEHAYACRRPVLTPLYGFFFGRMLRKEPEPGAWIVSGGSYVLMAALLVTVLYAPLAAGGALAVMLTGDAAAALIGRRFGRHRAPNNKSWEGVAAFLLVGGGIRTAGRWDADTGSRRFFFRSQLQIVEGAPAGIGFLFVPAGAFLSIQVLPAMRAESPALLGAEQVHRQLKQHFRPHILRNIQFILLRQLVEQTDAGIFNVAADRLQTAAAGA